MVRTDTSELSDVVTVRTKLCSGAHGCGELKSVSEFYFSHSSNRYDYYCKKCRANYSRLQNERNRERNKSRRREKHLCDNYALTQAQYDERLAAQNGVCAICERPEKLLNRKLAVDHDHATGKIRALLCYRCNRGIGMFEDNSSFLISAAAYLLQHKEVSNNAVAS